jgi:hypothetical protein
MFFHALLSDRECFGTLNVNPLARRMNFSASQCKAAPRHNRSTTISAPWLPSDSSLLTHTGAPDICPLVKYRIRDDDETDIKNKFSL